MMLQRLDMPENARINGGGGSGDGVATMRVLERQQVTRKWHEGELQAPPQLLQKAGLGYFNSSDQLSMFSGAAQAQHFHGLITNDQNLGGLIASPMNPSVQTGACNNAFGTIGSIRTGNGLAFGALNLGNFTDFGMNYEVSRTASCPPAVAAALAEASSAATGGKEAVLLQEKLSSSAARESFKKRKADKTHTQKEEVIEGESKDKKLKGCVEDEDSKSIEQKSGNAVVNNNNTEPSETSTKENSKTSEVQKPDYIHVRARRGQATDSHSLAERVRREKISERMKFLQDLVPGCNKITGKAGMLDEIINYVQSLQRQVEFLAMKLAAENPRLDLGFDNIFAKEVYPIGTSELHRIGESSEMNTPKYHFDSLPQVVSGCGLESDVNPPDSVLRRTSAPVPMIPETLIESPYFSQIQPSSTWDVELQNLYALEFEHEKSTLLLSQPCTGFMGGSDLKIVM